MGDMNLLPILIGALIPMIMGAIYYNEKLFGKAWMDSIGKTAEELQENANMLVTMVLSLGLSFLLSFMVNIVVETSHKACDPSGEVIFGSDHNFGHGAFHGLFISLDANDSVFMTKYICHNCFSNVWSNT